MQCDLSRLGEAERGAVQSLVSLDYRRAFLWTPTTAARDRRDPWVVEIVADVNLRNHFGLQDGDVFEIEVPLLACRDEHKLENSQRNPDARFELLVVSADGHRALNRQHIDD